MSSTKNKKRVGTNSASEVFEDIKIIGVDKNQIYKTDPKKSLYNVFFELSIEPPIEWVQIFEVERRWPRHTMWRHAWVDGRYIIVHCCLEEVKKYHLRDIKQDVEKTNLKYREHLRQWMLEQETKKKMKEKERKEIDDALNGLKFE